METQLIAALMALMLADAAPLIIASLGEMITERAGVVNLSLDGTLLITAMAGFAVAMTTGEVVFGFTAAILVGMFIAFIVALASLELHQSAVAVGFVLTILCTDLSSFLGNPFVRQAGPSVAFFPLPILSEIPVIGPIFFAQNPVVYFSYLMIIVTWFLIFRSRPGLILRGIGDNPSAAYARGINVRRLRYFYTIIGGGCVGLAGASYSLCVKLGWSYHMTAGLGWIALAIVIFGGWHPMKIALGAYLFGVLGSLGSLVQGIPELAQIIPTQVFQTAPFAFMILALFLVNNPRLERALAALPKPISGLLRRFLEVKPPAALVSAGSGQSWLR